MVELTLPSHSDVMCGWGQLGEDPLERMSKSECGAPMRLDPSEESRDGTGHHLDRADSWAVEAPSREQHHDHGLPRGSESIIGRTNCASADEASSVLDHTITSSTSVDAMSVTLHDECEHACEHGGKHRSLGSDRPETGMTEAEAKAMGKATLASGVSRNRPRGGKRGHQCAAIWYVAFRDTLLQWCAFRLARLMLKACTV